MSVETRRRSRPSGAVAVEAAGTREGAASLVPLEKAAIVLVGLDETLAREVLARLEPSEVEALTSAVDRLEPVEPRVRRAVGREFYGLALRRAAFGFDDLEQLADVDIRAAYREEDAGTWALALAGAARPVTGRVLGALGTSAAGALREAIARVGAFRLDAADAAQEAVVDRIVRLNDEAMLDLPEPGGREEIVV